MTARRWAKEKLSKYFPALTQKTALALNVGNLTQGADLLALITDIKGTNTTTPKNPSPSKTSDNQDKSKWMPKSELDTTLKMCGKSSTGSMVDLPAWIQECATKGTSEHYKLIIIQKFVMSNTLYDDADVPLTDPILKMIIRRDWTRKDGNMNIPYLLHVMDGMSPFTMIYLSKDEVVMLPTVPKN